MTKEELYQYMLAYQQEHQFNMKDQSNFITAMETIKPAKSSNTILDF